MTIKTDRYFRSLKTIDTFIDRALGIKPNGKILSGFDYDLDLLHAALANTYLETVSRRVDSIHLAIKQVPGASIYWERLSFLELDFNLINRMSFWHSIIQTKISMVIPKVFGYMDGLGKMQLLESSSFCRVQL